MFRNRAITAAQRLAGATRLNARCYSEAVQDAYNVTKLSNGVTVASQHSPYYYTNAGVYVEAGSRFEDEYLRGCSHVLDRMAYLSTSRMTSEEISRKLELAGGTHTCASSREAMMYQVTAHNNSVPEMMQILADTVLRPQLTTEELEEQKKSIEFEVRSIWEQSDLILPELVHMAAFVDNTLGNPLLCPVEQIPVITRDTLLTYRERLYRPERIVVAFVGLPHEEAVAIAEENFGDAKPSAEPPVEKTAPQYIGSEICIPQVPPIGNMPELVHMHIAFEGLAISDPDIYALATLQCLLGGGGSFSAGGPGKGMYSRLYTNVLNQLGYIDHCRAFHHSFSDSGLFGIAISGVPNAAPYLADIICRQMALLFTGEKPLKHDEVERAKHQLRSSLLMNLESRLVQVEDLGRQVQVLGKRILIEETLAHIESITPEDLVRVAQRVFTGNASATGLGRPTVVLQGDREAFGDVSAVVQRYGLGKTGSGAVKVSNVAPPKRSRFF